MARTLVQLDTCDACKKLGIEDAEAEGSVTLGIDGPPKRFELCTLHRIQLQPFYDLYADPNLGVEESLKPRKRATQSRALEPQEETSTQPELPATTTSAQEAPQEEQEDTEEEPKVVCPHEHARGGTMSYKARPFHASKIHGVPPWEIAWKDVDGRLTVPCTVHAECMKTGYSFPSKMSLSRHVRMSKLTPVPAAD